VTVLCGRLKAVCEASSQTVPALNSAAELHAELAALLKLSSRSVYSPYRVVSVWGPFRGIEHCALNSV